MASTGEKNATFAKLGREHKVRERRREKQARQKTRNGAGGVDPARLVDVMSTSRDR